MTHPPFARAQGIADWTTPSNPRRKNGRKGASAPIVRTKSIAPVGGNNRFGALLGMDGNEGILGGTGKVRALHEDAAETRARRRPARQLLHARAAPRRIGAVAAAAAAVVVEEEVGSGWLTALAGREEAPQLQRTLNRRHVDVGERHLDEEGGTPATRRRHPDAAARAAPPRLVSFPKALLDGVHVPHHGT